MTPQDERQLSDLLDEFSSRAGFKMTLEKLLRDWQEFVDEVASGYELTVYDYINDLDGRGLLEQILQRGPSSLRPELLATLKPIDDKYYQVTLPVGECLTSSHRPKGTPDWSCRIPKKLLPELKADLEDRGLI